MNVKLLRKIQKHILAEPKRYDQNSWLYRGQRALDKYGDEAPACKTVGCIAGWACVLSPGKSRHGHYEGRAQRLLGLDDDQAGRLFSPASYGFDSENGWPDKYVAQYKDAATSTGRVRAAIRRIDHFIKTNGAE